MTTGRINQVCKCIPVKKHKFFFLRNILIRKVRHKSPLIDFMFWLNMQRNRAWSGDKMNEYITVDQIISHIKGSITQLRRPRVHHNKDTHLDSIHKGKTLSAKRFILNRRSKIHPKCIEIHWTEAHRNMSTIKVYLFIWRPQLSWSPSARHCIHDAMNSAMMQCHCMDDAMNSAMMQWILPWCNAIAWMMQWIRPGCNESGQDAMNHCIIEVYCINDAMNDAMNWSSLHQWCNEWCNELKFIASMMQWMMQWCNAIASFLPKKNSTITYLSVWNFARRPIRWRRPLRNLLRNTWI